MSGYGGKWTTTSSLTAAIVGGCGGTFGPGDAGNRCQGSGAVPPNDQRPDGRSSTDLLREAATAAFNASRKLISDGAPASTDTAPCQPPLSAA